MELEDAVLALAALSQATRLKAFRALIEAEPDGVPAGDLAQQLGVPQNTLSTHLAKLARAGLIGSARAGRQIIYRAQMPHMETLLRFLTENCCHGEGCAATELAGSEATSEAVAGRGC